MLKNDNMNLGNTINGKIKKILFTSETSDQQALDKNCFSTRQRNERKSMNTQPILRKDSPQVSDRKYHVKSGLSLNQKQTNITEIQSMLKNNNPVKPTFKRRVNSESKVSQSKILIGNEHSPPKQESRINFAKKIIEDMKKATFKLKKSNSRYSPGNNHSRSMEMSQKSQKSLINRQKLMQSSMQKLKPSFNINEVKFYTSKKSLRKINNQTNDQAQKSFINPFKTQTFRVQESIFDQQSKAYTSQDQVMRKTLKKASQPLTSYSNFIKGGENEKYQIKMQFFAQYLKPPKNQTILAYVDLTSLKLVQSIYLCLIDLLSIPSDDKRSKTPKVLNYDIVKQYVGVYLQTYSKMKMEYILSEGIFKPAKKRLQQYYVMQRVVFYWIHQKCKTQGLLASPQLSIKNIIQFLKLSQEILKTIINFIYEDISKNSQDTLIDTFKSLRLARQIDKRLPQLKATVQLIKQSQPFSDLFISLVQMLDLTQKQAYFDITSLFQLQQYFNWTHSQIPPLFYLPAPPQKPYTLAIDLDGTLIHYNEQTKILKYRPFMDRFLTTMQQHFQLIIFSSHTKDRTDIIVKEIERDEKIFAYRLYKSHMVFQQGMLRKNIDYLGRSLQKLILIDDEEKNTLGRSLNSFKIKQFTGDKQDKELLNLADWLINLIQTQPGDIRGKLKKHQSILDEVQQVDQMSSTIQPSIEYFQDAKIKKSIHKG